MEHYSICQRPALLREWAGITAKLVAEAAGLHNKYPVLIYRGMSGIGSATALSLALYDLGVKHGMMYVRKENESSHGSHLQSENICGNKHVAFIFCDDLIASGSTRAKTLKECKTAFHRWFPDGYSYLCFTALSGTRSGGDPCAFYLRDEHGETLFRKDFSLDYCAQERRDDLAMETA